MIGNRARAARSPEAARTAALPISAFCPVFSGAFTVRFVTFSPSSGGHCSSPTRRSCAVFSRELGWMARRGDPRGPSNAHVRVHVGGALVPRSAKWGRLVRRFWPVFGTLEYAAGTMDAGWPPNAGEHLERPGDDPTIPRRARYTNRIHHEGDSSERRFARTRRSSLRRRSSRRSATWNRLTLAHEQARLDGGTPGSDERGGNAAAPLVLGCATGRSEAAGRAEGQWDAAPATRGCRRPGR